MSLSIILKSSALLLMLSLLVACNKDDDKKQPIESKQAVLLVDGSNMGSFGLFSFEKGELIPQASSNTVDWDFGLRFATFNVNSGVSGPGNAGVQIQTGVFDEILTAPAEGYAIDTSATELAVKDADWYIYNPVTRTFAPRAGQVFIFRTATGKYAKMEVLNADPADNNGNPVTPPTIPTKIKYTIRYVFQPDGSRDF